MFLRRVCIRPAALQARLSLVTSRAMSDLAPGKKAAAVQAVNEWVKDGQKVGIGSGSTIVYAVERLAERVQSEKLSVVCVPTSFQVRDGQGYPPLSTVQARQLIIENGLLLSDLENHPRLDVAIDGADEADPHLTLIKGGGGCQTQEKVVAASADVFVVIADDSKQSTYLGEKWQKGLPIEVLPFAYKPVQCKLQLLGGSADLRIAKQKAGPVVTDNGNLIIDWKFIPKKDTDWAQVASNLSKIPGIVETGLFIGMANVAYFGSADGSVRTVKQRNAS